MLIPGLLLAEALVLGAVLAPTDAALGQAVVTDQRVPSKLRQALNVESGLNDGLIAPVVTVAVGLAVMGGEAETVGEVTSFIVRAVGFGVVFGSAVGWLGGKTLSWAAERKWVDGVFRQPARDLGHRRDCVCGCGGARRQRVRSGVRGRTGLRLRGS